MIVTVSRQNGSGGREVARLLAERLGVRCYDQEIVSETADQSGIPLEKVRTSEEGRWKSPLYFGGVPAANPVFEAEAEVIRRIADEGPCVFVGRCADFVLEDRDDVVNVFVTAPLEARVRRSSERNGTEPDDARAWVQRTDAERARYYQGFTGRTWGAVTNYDLAVNTGDIGV